jgi:hypothetical protein
MSVSLPRRKEALYATCLNLIHRFGKSRCVDIELTFKKNHTSKTIKRAIRELAKRCRREIPMMIGVPGVTISSCHVHILGILPKNPPTYTYLKRFVREQRLKCGFSFKHDVGPIRKTPEQFSRYLARNFGESLEYYTIGLSKPPGQLVVFSGIPREWRVKASSFTRLTPHSRRFRASMNRLAELAGTPIGDYKALESALCVRADRIRRIVFGLFSETPFRVSKSGKCASLPDRILLRTFPMLRSRTTDNQQESEEKRDNEE